MGQSLQKIGCGSFRAPATYIELGSYSATAACTCATAYGSFQGKLCDLGMLLMHYDALIMRRATSKHPPSQNLEIRLNFSTACSVFFVIGGGKMIGGGQILSIVHFTEFMTLIHR